MESLVQLSAFMETQSPSQLASIHSKHLPQVPISTKLRDDIFHHFYGAIVAVASIGDLDTIRKQIGHIIHDDADEIRPPPAKKIKLDDEMEPEAFETLPDAIIGEIMNYLHFADTISFEQVNRRIFIVCRQLGIKHSESPDLDELLMRVIGNPAGEIYKLDRYTHLREISLGDGVLEAWKNDQQTTAEILDQLLGQKIRSLRIENFQLNRDQLASFFVTNLLKLKSISTFTVQTDGNFDMEFLESFTELKAVRLMAPDFVLSPVIQLEAFDCRWKYGYDANFKITFAMMPALRSFHCGAHCHFEPAIGARLEEICLNSTVSWNWFDTEKKDQKNVPAFPLLKRMCVQYPTQINPYYRKLWSQAPQLLAIHLCVENVETARIFIESALTGIIPKKMKFLIYTKHTAVELNHQYGELLYISQICDEKLDEFMIAFSGPSQFNLDEPEIAHFRRDMGKIYNDAADGAIFCGDIYSFYFDTTIHKIAYNGRLYKSTGFIFRKGMQNDVIEQFNYKCGSCDFCAIFA